MIFFILNLLFGSELSQNYLIKEHRKYNMKSNKLEHQEQDSMVMLSTVTWHRTPKTFNEMTGFPKHIYCEFVFLITLRFQPHKGSHRLGFIFRMVSLHKHTIAYYKIWNTEMPESNVT